MQAEFTRARLRRIGMLFSKAEIFARFIQREIKRASHARFRRFRAVPSRQFLQVCYGAMQDDSKAKAIFKERSSVPYFGELQLQQGTAVGARNYSFSLPCSFNRA